MMETNKKYFRVLIFFLGGLYCFLALSTCQQECKELPDLYGVIDSDNDTVMQGMDYYYDHTIKNVEAAYNIDGCKNVSTKTAGNSNTRIIVQYSEDPKTKPYAEKTNDFFPVTSIEAGGAVSELYSSNFDSIGSYRIIAISDGKIQVEERNENNNEANREAGGIGLILGGSGYFKGLIVEVLPNPDFNVDSFQQLHGSVYTRRLRAPIYYPPQ